MINELHSIKAKVYSPVKMNTTLNAGIAKPEAGLRERVDEVEKQVEDLQLFDEEVSKALKQQDENTQTIVNKIVEIDEKDETQDALIENLQNQIVELEAENENLKNQIPTGQAEGEAITLTDSSNMPFELFRPSGNSWQETRSGKNKFNALNPTSSNYATSKFEDDITTISSSITNTFPFVGWKFDNLNAGDIVRIKSILLDNNCQAFLQVYNGTDWTSLTTSKLSYIDGTTESSYAYTVSSAVTAVRLLLYSSNVIPTGEISARYKNVIVTINNEDMSYEPYGATPSPEFRSEIRNVGENGSANITVCNENLFNEDEAKISTNYKKYGENPVNGYWGYKIQLKPNTTYTIWRPNNQGFSSGYYAFIGIGERIAIDKVGGGDWIIHSSSSTLCRQILNMTTDDTGCFCFILGYSVTQITQEQVNKIWEVLDKVMIVEGRYALSTIPDYIPHQSQQFTFPLKPGQRMYKDSYLADDGVHHTWREYIITGNEGWILGPVFSGAVGTRFDAAVYTQPRAGDNEVICTHYAYNGTNKKGCWVNAAVETKALDLRIQDETITTVKDLTAFLQEQYANGTPVTIQYPLFEEIIEPYTEEQQLVYNEIKKAHSYKNVTHIFSTDEIKPVVEVTYRKDLNTIGGDDYVITETDKKEIANTVVPMVQQTIQPTLNKIQATAQQAESIARGRATGYVFDTIQDLDLWLQNEQNVSKLVLGDNFYIREINVPDYWWDGTQKQQLEAEKPVLTGFVKEEELENYATKEYIEDLIGDIERELGGI